MDWIQTLLQQVISEVLGTTDSVGAEHYGSTREGAWSQLKRRIIEKLKLLSIVIF